MANKQTTNDDGIRPYGPGKFDTILDSYVYGVTLDGGCDDEIGSVTENGAWYGLMKNGRTIFRNNDPFLETLNETEETKLTESAGVIVREDSDGFVSVDYFENDDELQTAWDAIASALAETFGDDTNDDDDEDFSAI